jgi:hypothetical protein
MIPVAAIDIVKTRSPRYNSDASRINDFSQRQVILVVDP